MCDDLALVAAVGRAAAIARQLPLVGWAVVGLLGRARLDAVELIELTGAEASVITRVITGLRRAGVIDGDNQLAERWRGAKPARSAHAEAQARYRGRQKARKSAIIEADDADDHLTSRVIMRDHSGITADITRDHAADEEQKTAEIRHSVGGGSRLRVVAPDQEGKGIDNINSSFPKDQGEHASEKMEDSGLRPAQARRMNWTNKLQLAAKRILPPDHYCELGRRLKQPELYGFIMQRAPLDPWVKTTFEVIDLRLKEEVQAAAELRSQPRLPLSIAGGTPAPGPGGRVLVEVDDGEVERLALNI